MSAEIVVDATPLANAHARRGTGAAVRGLIEGFRTLAEADRPRLVIGVDDPPPPGFVAVRLSGRRRVAREIEEIRTGASFHATQPDLVPDAAGVVATCFDLIPARMPKTYLAGPLRVGARRDYRAYLSRLAGVEAIVVPSHATAADLIELAQIDRRRIHVVPLAAAPQAAPEGPVPAGEYVLYSGSVEPHKNLATAIEAIAKSRSGARLVVVGPWSRRRVERLQRHARAVGASQRIDWRGFTSPGELAALRAGARAVLVPSLIEGFGLPVLEAMVVGVPVVASDIASLREVAGDCADLVAARDTDAWAAAVDRLVDDAAHRERRVAAGLRRAAHFSWDRTAMGVIAVHEGLGRG
jgi:glycosyltransferase involved in cell wall biosynthesis